MCMMSGRIDTAKRFRICIRECIRGRHWSADECIQIHMHTRQYMTAVPHSAFVRTMLATPSYPPPSISISSMSPHAFSHVSPDPLCGHEMPPPVPNRPRFATHGVYIHGVYTNMVSTHDRI